MSSKRDREGSESCQSSDERANKRSKKQQPKTKARQHQNSHIDPTWGQKYVFSSYDDATTIPVDSDLDAESDTDAMAYLSSVRQQANEIPHLLVAPRVPIGPQIPEGFETSTGDNQKEGDRGTEEAVDSEANRVDRGIYEMGTGDFRGRYEDGAYIGGPSDWDEAYGEDYDYEDADIQYGDDSNNDGGYWDEGEAEDDGGDYYDEHALHEAYFSSLMRQYLSLREVLQRTPPKSAVEALPRAHSSYVGNFGPRSSTFSIWRDRIQNTDPVTVQIANMDRDAVLRVIRVLLQGKFLRRGCELSERTSRWLWALLARLPNRGEMTHVDVGWVRDLGRRAVLLAQSLAHMANLREEIERQGMDLGVHDAVDDSDEDGDEEAFQDAEVEDGGDDDDEEVAESSGSRHDPAGEAGKSDVAVDEPADAVVDDISTAGANVETAEQGDKETEEVESPGSEDGEVADDGEDQQSQAMDCSEDPEPDSLEAARARILAQLDSVAEDDPAAPDDLAKDAAQQDEDEAKDHQLRARMNMRATVNMILTVAGEFYGQRDLLEFRDPFTGM